MCLCKHWLFFFFLCLWGRSILVPSKNVFFPSRKNHVDFDLVLKMDRNKKIKSLTASLRVDWMSMLSQENQLHIIIIFFIYLFIYFFLSFFWTNFSQSFQCVCFFFFFSPLTFSCLCLSPQEQEDLALAQALAASEEEYRRQQQRQQVPGKLIRQ